MLSSAFELGEQLNLRTIQYHLYHDQWDKFMFRDIILSFSHWRVIKLLNESGTDFSDEIEELPNNKGGVYMFFIECPIIRGITEFPLYVGRAQLTDGQNLRKRVREYFTKYARNEERPKITKMFKYWAKDLKVAFLCLDENDDIIELEKNFINSLLLPMNDLIPDKETKEAIKAFK